MHSDDLQAAAPGDPVVRQRKQAWGNYCVDTGELPALLGERRLEVVQTEPGRAKHQITVLPLEKMTWIHAIQQAAWTASFTAKKGRIYIMLLVHPPPPDYVVAGEPVKGDHFFCYTPGMEHSSRHHQPCEFLCCSFDDNHLKEEYNRQTGRDLPERIGRLTLARQVLEPVCTAMIRSVERMLADHPWGADPTWRSNYERSLTSQCVQLLCRAQQANSSHEGVAVHHHQQIVRTARAYLREHLAKPVYVGELCEAVGASERALQQAFMSLLGVSPIRYLKLRRLQLVRKALRDPDVPAMSVKRIALNFGFWDLGRFAVEYRTFFGEKPSVTLNGSLTNIYRTSEVPDRAANRDLAAEMVGS